ncbi:DUF2262 domain-containing protein [Cognatilysobacter bugurensis]|uniref:DUF2262 domain-containing protein n=1 Tax=Cognatilysobacter bugurensis TaxID=543356 RepID=A0A918SXN1_9GAMM|nr:DUF2262 domain-containing protein [Lysobacter bugurensis]GHA76754.1 hypothetical protein GCM10007067_12530 [Lysobacter bugurensis]
MRLLRSVYSRFRRTPNQRVTEILTVVIEHPVLGNLTPCRELPGSLCGQLRYGEDLIDLTVSPDNKGIECALVLATSLAQSLEHLDFTCRRLVADTSLEGYNSDWRFGLVAQGDGTFERVEEPPLTREDFCRNLKLSSIVASGEAMLLFYYGDSDMFGGHSVEVTSFDGTAFQDTDVSLVG